MMNGRSPMLTGDEKRELLRIARASIERAVVGGEAAPRHGAGMQDAAHADGQVRGRLDEPGGAFVTLRIGHDLRGCIGYIESTEPLRQVVEEVARKSALEDPRFVPVTPAEVPHLKMEISVLTPLRQVHDVNEIQVGAHGLLIERGGHRGLLLPQVATEYGWDRTGFLESTARKAGLPRTAWKDPEAKIYLFGAEVFQDDVA